VLNQDRRGQDEQTLQCAVSSLVEDQPAIANAW